MAQQRVLRGILTLLLGVTTGNALLSNRISCSTCLYQVCMMVDDVLLFAVVSASGSSSIVVFNVSDLTALRSPGFALTIYLPVLLTNFISTVMIFHKTWFVFHLIRL